MKSKVALLSAGPSLTKMLPIYTAVGPFDYTIAINRALWCPWVRNRGVEAFCALDRQTLQWLTFKKPAVLDRDSVRECFIVNEPVRAELESTGFIHDDGVTGLDGRRVLIPKDIYKDVHQPGRWGEAWTGNTSFAVAIAFCATLDVCDVEVHVFGADWKGDMDAGGFSYNARNNPGRWKSEAEQYRKLEELMGRCNVTLKRYHL